jgi:hypothetical protein
VRSASWARRVVAVSVSVAAMAGGLSTRAGASPPLPVGVHAVGVHAVGVHGRRAPSCRTASLRLIRGPACGAQGRAYAVFDLANASRSSCDLEGFPGVNLLRPDGKAQTVRERKTTASGVFSPAVAEARVRLAPGSVADFWIEWAERLGRLRGSMLVTPPGQRRAIKVLNRCVVLDVGTVTVSPLTSRVLTS